MFEDASAVCYMNLRHMCEHMWNSEDFFSSDPIHAFEALVRAQTVEEVAIERARESGEILLVHHVITPRMVLAAAMSKLMFEWGYLKSEVWYRENETHRHRMKVKRYLSGVALEPPVDSIAFLFAIGWIGTDVISAKYMWESAVDRGDRTGCRIDPEWWRWFVQLDSGNVMCFRRRHEALTRGSAVVVDMGDH